MSKSQVLVGTVSILDRGDGPAQEVLDRNARAIAQRVAEETREELNKVMSRVRNSLELFESSSKLDVESAQGSVEYVNDLAELETLLNDQMKRRKYQQQLTVFVVGYQNKSGQRLKLLQQVGEFFTDTINRWEADEAVPKSPDFDLEETDRNIHESLQTATELAGRLGDLNREMMDYMYSYATSKAGNNGIPLFQNRKKLEKSLILAKEEMLSLTDKVSSMQKEIEEKDEKIQQLFKQVEMKTMETQRLKAAAEVTKRNVQDSSAISSSLDSKDQTIKELQKKIEALEFDLKQKEASREQTQKELLMTGREGLVKVKELEEKLQTVQLERMQEKRALQEFGEKQLTTLANVHREEMSEIKAKYEAEIGKLKLVEKQDADVRALQYQLGEHRRQIELLKQQLEQVEASKQRALDDALKAAREQSEAALAAAVSAAAAVAATAAVRSQDDGAASTGKDEIEESQGTKSKVAPGAQGRNGAGRKPGKPDVKGAKSVRQKEGAEHVEEDDRTGDDTVDDDGRKAAKAAPIVPSEPPAIDYESSFFDEGLWNSLQIEHTPEIFFKYRNKAVEKIRRLESEIEDVNSKAAKKVETVKAQFHEHKERWQRERDSFVEQIEVAQRMRREAELEADAALNKLEDFISEQESLEKDEEKNALARQQALAHREAAAAAAAVAAAATEAGATGSPAATATTASAIASEPAPLAGAAESETRAVDEGTSVDAVAPQEIMPQPATGEPKVAVQVLTPRSRSTSRPGDLQVALASDENLLDKGTATAMALPTAGASLIDATTSPSVAADSAATADRVLEDLRQILRGGEERLDSMQQNALSEFRSAIEFSSKRQQLTPKSSSNTSTNAPQPQSPAVVAAVGASAVAALTDGGGEDDIRRRQTLTVFGLASKLSSESYYLGYEPGGLLQALVSLYANGGKMLYSWKPGMPAVAMLDGWAARSGGGDASSVLTAGNAVQSTSRSPLGVTPSATSRVALQEGVGTDEQILHLDLESVAADIEDAASVEVAASHSAPESTSSHSPLDVAESLRSESLAAQHTASGRSSADSQTSVHSKYRSVLEEARASIEERRQSRSSAVSRMSVPSKASFHEAELDEDGDMPFPDDIQASARDSLEPPPAAAIGARLSAAGRVVSVRNQSTEVSRRSYYDRTTSFSLRAASVTSYSPSPSLVSKEDAATSPHFVIFGVDDDDDLDVTAWKSPPLSSHPVVLEYLKAYQMVHNFKEVIAKALQDKDMMSAGHVLMEIEPIPLDESSPVTSQIEDMTKNIGNVLDEASIAVDSALTSLAGKEYRVSSLLSVDRRSGTAGSFYSTRQNSADLLPLSARTLRPTAKTPGPLALTNTPVETVALKDLQQRFDILQKEYIEHKQKHEIEVQHNTVMLMEMQDHVAELQRRLADTDRAATGTPRARIKERVESGNNSPIMFTRLDAERNTKNLKRAALNNRVNPTKLSDALAKMEAYVSIPEQRFSEMVKKYVHVTNMKNIAKTIRDSQHLTRSELMLLSRMEALQVNKHERWLQRMDELGYERLRLAAELTDFLETLEMESGIFLIKPIFSYQGFQAEDSLYTHEKLTTRAVRGTILGTSSVYPKELQKDTLSSPMSPRVLVNRTAVDLTLNTAERRHQKRTSAWADVPQQQAAASMTAAVASTGLPSLGYTWSLSSSVVRDSGGGKATAALFDTPRLLEMDVNRMMYGQSQVSVRIPASSAGPGAVAGDRASSYLRSYVTVTRPVKAQSTAAATNGSTDRPQSGDAAARLSPDSRTAIPTDISASWSGKGRVSPLPPIVKAQGHQHNVGGSNTLVIREYSEDAITPSRLMRLLESARSDISTPAEADELDVADDD